MSAFFEEEVFNRAGKDLGIVLMREIVKDIHIERLEEQAKKMEEENLNLRVKIAAQEADINSLREQVGAKPLQKRGVKPTSPA